MKKQCFKCGRTLDIKEFYPHFQMKDGHLNKCKDCTRADSARRLREHPDKVREYEQKRSKTPKRKALAAMYLKKYRAEHPGRTNINARVQRAIKRGEIIKPNCCQICGKTSTLCAHHHDYNKPLDVIFVCQSCHKKIHCGTL